MRVVALALDVYLISSLLENVNNQVMRGRRQCISETSFCAEVIFEEVKKLEL